MIWIFDQYGLYASSQIRNLFIVIDIHNQLDFQKFGNAHSSHNCPLFLRNLRELVTPKKPTFGTTTSFWFTLVIRETISITAPPGKAGAKAIYVPILPTSPTRIEQLYMQSRDR